MYTHVLVEHILPIAAQIDLFSGCGKNLYYSSPVYRYFVQLWLRTVREGSVIDRIETHSPKKNILVINTEGIRIFIGGMVSCLLGFPAFSRDDEDVKVSIAVTRKSDMVGIVTPYRHKIMSLVQGQRRGVSTVTGYPIQVIFIGENDCFPIGWDSWVTQPGWTVLSCNISEGNKKQEDKKNCFFIAEWISSWLDGLYFFSRMDVRKHTRKGQVFIAQGDRCNLYLSPQNPWLTPR